MHGLLLAFKSEIQFFSISYILSPLIAVFVLCLFEIGSHCVSLLAKNSLCKPGWPQTQTSVCLCLSSAVPGLKVCAFSPSHCCCVLSHVCICCWFSGLFRVDPVLVAQRLLKSFQFFPLFLLSKLLRLFLISTFLLCLFKLSVARAKSIFLLELH